LGYGIARKPLAAACIAALLMSGVAAAQDTQTPPATTPPQQQQPQTQAQGNQAEDANKKPAPGQVSNLQEVVVTGIRGSIESSIRAKQNSDSIIEAISAEDIGKLPDASIAESLARLSGLATQRVDGRANVISIRGLSPDFAGTTLNGREQATIGENRG